jgi:hypothetical protein
MPPPVLPILNKPTNARKECVTIYHSSRLPVSVLADTTSSLIGPLPDNHEQHDGGCKGKAVPVEHEHLSLIGGIRTNRVCVDLPCHNVLAVVVP